jgi:hypothetical protein
VLDPVLQETCLIGQLMAGGFNKSAVQPLIAGKSMDGAGRGKNVVFIVYNFFEKCLN